MRCVFRERDRRRLALCVALLAIRAASAAEVEPLLVARDGQPQVAIVQAEGATVPEQTAVRELTTYLKKATGATFAAIGESSARQDQPAIYVGQTAFAKSHGIDVGALGPEESVLRSVLGALILTGGRPRGTLYAVYTFMEDALGVRWYTPWYEHVPRQFTCTIEPIDKRVSPTFAYRDVYTHCSNGRTFPQQDLWRWYVIRNRFNGAGISPYVWGEYRRTKWAPHRSEPVPRADSPIGPGWSVFGGPHSFHSILPVAKYFQTNPEFYSLRKGQRVPSSGQDGNHLCLTNQQMRRAAIERMKEAMREFPELRVFSVCMNDGGSRSACDCDKCVAVADQSSWTDLHLDFVNTIADGIKGEFPENLIYTLAYSYASRPPKTTRARDNVIIQACLLFSGRTLLVGEDDAQHAMLREWGKWTRNLWVWDYAFPTGMTVTFLQPTYDRMQAGYQLAHKTGGRGVFAENELLAWGLPIVPEHYGMRLWIMSKLMQNPDADLDALIADFTTGYYGKAGASVKAYVDMERQRLDRWPMRVFDLDFVRKGQALFDGAEAAVQDEPTVLKRVRTARAWLDVGTLYFRSALRGEFLRDGGKLEDFPYQTVALKQRVLSALGQTENLFWRVLYPFPSRRGGREPRREGVEHATIYLDSLCRGKDYCPLPGQFSGIEPDRILDIPGHHIKPGRRYQVVVDPDSAFGLAISGEHDDEMPFSMGVYDQTVGRGLVGRRLNERDVGVSLDGKSIVGSGYHIYELGRTIVTPRCYVWLTKSWQIQQPLDMLHDPTRMDAQWDIYVSLKLTGPAYPHGKPDEKNAIYFDRMILVKVQE